MRRKIQHTLFQPCMVDLSQNKLKVLEEVRNKDKTSHGIVSIISDEIQSELLGHSDGSYPIKLRINCVDI